MSFRVVGEVLDKSEARGVDRLVLVALAEAAWRDGVCWLKLGDGEHERGTICSAAHCSKREAIRAVQQIRDELREVETRKVRRGRSFVTVYRVVVGSIGGQEIDYDRLPFEVDPPFLHGDELARWVAAAGAGVSLSGLSDPSQVEGDDLAPSTGPVTVPSAAAQGDSDDPFRVTSRPSSPLTGSRTGPEPSDNRSVSEPESGEEEDEEDRRLARVRAELAGAATSLRLARRRQICPECGVGGGQHVVDCTARCETTLQAYERFVDEYAGRLDFPLEELAAVVETWHDIDDVDRQELLERAETIRAGEPARAGKAAA